MGNVVLNVSHVLILLLLLATSAHGMLPGNNGVVKEGIRYQYAYLYKDEPQTFEQVTALPNNEWQQVKQFRSHGFKPGEFWLRISAENVSDDTLHRVVRFTYALHDYVDIYQVDENKKLLEFWQLGDAEYHTSRPVREKNPAFPLTLNPEEVVHSYVRIKGVNALNLTAEVLNLEDHSYTLQISILIAGLVYGILSVMAIYNLGLAIFTADKAYFFYVGYVVTFTCFALALTGDGYYYLWNESPNFNAYSIPLFAGIMAIPTIYFIFYLLNVKLNAPHLVQIFRVLGLVSFLFIIASLFLPLPISLKIINIMSILISIFVLGVGIYLYFKRVPVALIYVIAWVIPLVGFALLSISSLGVIESNSFTQNASIFGGVIETIILSLALAYRIRLERQAKEQAMEATILAEEQAADSRLMYQELYDHAPIGMFRYTLEGKLIAVNPVLATMMGFDSIDGVFSYDGDVRRLFSGGRRLAVDILSKRQVVDREVELTSVQGDKKDCSMSLHVHDTSRGGMVEGYIVDITERKKAQHIRDVMEKERMSSMEQMVTGVAHELNTPIGTNITSLTHLSDLIEKIEEKLEAGSLTVQDFKDFIRDSQSVADIMTENMKTMSNLVKRFKLVSVKNMNIEKAVMNVKDQFSSLFDSYLVMHPNLSIEVETHGIDEVVSYPAAWHIIIDQLIENSLAHGFNKTQKNKLIKMELKRNEVKAYFEYRDNGVGIDDEMKENIFNPFSTSNRGSTDNSGLGMYKVYNVVKEVLKGKITVLDGPGFGLLIELRRERYD